MFFAKFRWTLDIEKEILKEIEGIYPIAHICSGASGVGDIRIDKILLDDTYQTAEHEGCRIFGKPNLCGDMCDLPLKSGAFRAVICDPPYDMKQHGKQLPLLFSELARITAPGGKVIFLAPWIIQNEVLEPKRIWLRPAGIRKGAFPVYKILSISYKTNGMIGDYVNGCVKPSACPK